MSFFWQIFSARRRVYANCLSACTVSAKPYTGETSPYITRKQYGNSKVHQRERAPGRRKPISLMSNVSENNYTCKSLSPLCACKFSAKEYQFCTRCKETSLVLYLFRAEFVIFKAQKSSFSIQIYKHMNDSDICNIFLQNYMHQPIFSSKGPNRERWETRGQ